MYDTIYIFGSMVLHKKIEKKEEERQQAFDSLLLCPSIEYSRGYEN